MPRSLRYAVLIPLSILAFYVLFVLPDIDLGWAGGLAVLAGAWVVWYLLWATLQESAASARADEAAAPVSPGEQRAWIGLVFTAAILVYFALRSPQMVAADGTMAPEASAIGRHIDARGGRSVLVASALVLPAGLVLLAGAQGPVSLVFAWVVLGAGMALGLYDTAFAALAAMYGHAARSPITGITLMAGFASTIGWPVSAWLDHAIGWRGACLAWAIVHVAVTLPCYLVAVPGRAKHERQAAAAASSAPSDAPARRAVLNL